MDKFWLVIPALQIVELTPIRQLSHTAVRAHVFDESRKFNLDINYFYNNKHRLDEKNMYSLGDFLPATVYRIIAGVV